MSYSIDESNLERQQLLARLLLPVTVSALQLLELPTPASILDIGCGLGHTTQMLSGHFAGADVTGADLDETLLAVATSNYGHLPNLHFKKADAASLPFDNNRFDLVFSRYLLMHVDDPVAALAEMKRVCKPGGVIMAAEPDCSLFESHPHCGAYAQIPVWFATLFKDALIGRKLGSHFTAAGWQDVAVYCRMAYEAADNQEVKRLIRLTAGAMGATLLNKKVADASFLQQVLAGLVRAENDAGTFLLTHPIVFATARKT